MKYTTLLLLLVATCTLAKIGPGKGIPDVVMLETDVLSQDLSVSFDLSDARNPIKSETSSGFIYGDHLPFQSQDYARYGVKKLMHVQWVAHNIAALVFDHHKVVFQIIDGNGKLLLKSYFHDFNVLKELYCSGFEYNSERNYVYVGCFETRQQSKPGVVLLSTFDLTMGEVVSELSLNQEDGFEIRNNLVLRIIHAP